jgi:putative oxidoreductase
MIQPLFVFSDWAFLVLRIALGVAMIYHGFPKLKNLKATGEAFSGMGFKPGNFWALIVGVLEGVGGVFLVIGLLTQVISLLLAVEFLVILLKLKKFGNIKEYEFDLVIFASLLVLVTVGGGVASIDGFFGIFLY